MPLPHVSLHLLDADRDPVPPGEVGELWVGGSGVARGYWRRPTLTAERFASDPAGGRRYRTGDRAVVAPEGQWEHRGRVDNQLTVGGYRIEPGEIEACLRTCPGIAQAAVVANDHGRLVAFVVARPGYRPAMLELRLHVGQNLPDHMVPTRYIQVDAFPLTVDGKRDDAALARMASQLRVPRRPHVTRHRVGQFSTS